MPIILSFDVESTGLDPVQDRVIEVGAVLWSTGQHKCLESSGYLVKSDVPVSEKITSLTGITQSAVDRFGYDPKDALSALLDMADQADAFIGQNVKRFDKLFLENWAKRHNMEVPNKLWIDTCTDLPAEGGGAVEKKHLGYLAADHGFLNMFPHSALADCQTVIKIVSMYDINKVIERAQSPDVVLIGHQSRENNDQAKARKFRWNGDYKIWWKCLKQMDVERETKEYPFDVSFAGPEISIEKLWYGN